MRWWTGSIKRFWSGWAEISPDPPFTKGGTAPGGQHRPDGAAQDDYGADGGGKPSPSAPLPLGEESGIPLLRKCNYTFTLYGYDDRLIFR
jgi:hypothetical protein